MIRILIEDKLGVVVEALVNVKMRRVESLVVETERGLNEAFIAEALVALELEIEMAARTTRKPEVSLTLDTSKFDAALARYQEVMKDTVQETVKEFAQGRIVAFSNAEPFAFRVDTLKREQPTGPEALTNEQMAAAMGLVPCRAEWDSSCEACDEASIDWMRMKGQVLIGWCNACLPSAYDAHVIEQGELDRMVEADDRLKPELRAEKRVEDLKCEGGCE
jgi:hypothetical protein